MNKKTFILPCVVSAMFTVAACGDSTMSDDANNSLRHLINVGYSLKELSIRTDYAEDELAKAYLSNDDVLTDSTGNKKLLKILELHNDKKIIPINKTNISAYDCIWQLYTKAQNLPRTSLYTGIGVSKVAGALMKRKSLNMEDSIKALIGYVNMKYELDEMPPSIDKYYTKTSILKDVIVPITFHPSVSDETKIKIDYYIYQNEQLELKANENLHKSLNSKIDSHISEAIEQFINDDVSSLINIGKCILKDSLEEVNFYKEKLSSRLALDKLNKDVRDEIITYCVSVNCSRAILISEVLNYNEYTKSADIPDRVLLEEYVARLENLTNLMEKQKQNLEVEAGTMAITIPFAALTSGAMAPATSIFSAQAVKVFAIETLEYTGLDTIIKDSFDYEENKKSIEESTKKLQKDLKSDLDEQMTKSLNGKNSYFESLNKNTKEYYQQVREYFLIK